jgi:hypothetical protein
MDRNEPMTLAIRAITIAVLALMFATHLSAEWFKGNTHTHTVNSGGDSTPYATAEWYRLHGYQFLFITDHDMATDTAALNTMIDSNGQFLVLPGEEVTSEFKTPQGNIYVHVNALGPQKIIESVRGTSVRDTLQKDIDAVREAGGLAQINHPNYMWQITEDDLVAVHGASLLEIMNMHPLVNSTGVGPEYPSVEDLWDKVLSRGVKMWGVASDDTHDLLPTSEAEGLPGKGWIVVRSQHLTAQDISGAIKSGDFYASTGVTLKDYQATDGGITITIQNDGPFLRRTRTQFIGVDGAVLKDTTSNPATYSFTGQEVYVRARIVDSNGNRAWTQPVFVHDGR